MGNQLSTWNLTHQSAVRGPSFDEFPGYNEERIFPYWPFISLVVMGVMVTILLLLKFSDKICRVRMTAGGGCVEQQKYHQDDHNLEMMEDGAGTMMDFNLQDP